MRENIKSVLPAPLLSALRETRDAVQRASEWPMATFHPSRRKSIQQLAALKNIHQGKRCFIIGNGPSLKNTDLDLLKNEVTFGMNRVYLAFPDWGFSTSYLVSVNTLVIEQCAAELLAQPVPKFFSWRSRHAVDPHVNPETASSPIYLNTSYTGPRFATDARSRLWEGATVTYVCLQLAYHMGFETSILIGVDHSFATSGKPNTTVVSEGDDPNHFAANYFGKGFRWQLPDLDTSEIGYWMARKAYERTGRQVLDATIDGKLQVFEKADYESLFGQRQDD